MPYPAGSGRSNRPRFQETGCRLPGRYLSQGGVPIKTLCPGNKILIGLCLADTISTLILTSLGGSEANPIMAYFLNRSAWLFVLAKIASFLPAVILLENYRRRRPANADLMIYATILLYLFIYVAAFIRVNFG